MYRTANGLRSANNVIFNMQHQSQQSIRQHEPAVTMLVFVDITNLRQHKFRRSAEQRYMFPYGLDNARNINNKMPANTLVSKYA